MLIITETYFSEKTHKNMFCTNKKSSIELKGKASPEFYCYWAALRLLRLLTLELLLENHDLNKDLF